MRQDDTFAFLVKFNYLELQFFVQLSLAAVFFYQMFRSSKAFYTIFQLDYGTFVQHLDDSTFVNRVHREYGFKHIPRVLFKLLVTQAQTTVFFVDFQYLNLDFCANLREFRRMFDLLGPRKVGDMNQAVYAFFYLNEYAEVCKVAYFGRMFGTHGVFLFDVFPRIGFQLLDTQRHFTFFTIQGQNDSFYFVTYLHEVLCGTQVLAPRHFRYVDQAFYARSDFDECTVIGHHDNFAFYFVTYFQVRIQSVPRMRSQLFQTQCDTLLLVVEVKDNHIDLLVKLYHFFRVAHTSPREVGDVNQTVYAAQVDEDAVRGDILNGTLEYLSFFKLADDFFFLLFQFGFDKSLVRNNDILEFLVDFNDLEFHSLSYEYIVVADRFHVDL